LQDVIADEMEAKLMMRKVTSQQIDLSELAEFQQEAKVYAFSYLLSAIWFILLNCNFVPQR
jgi:hypothetical protein